ncbi:hypothetical protein GE107_25430 [Cohnella sp. CFH 77786]|uniref:ATP-binding protein n=1 Tax=Cohnella sp. CFH 77786 TaxID=2662265 RepID=UPI001C60E380|nr:ATP-binding protein [Cohnella sp. CFH 77786]MBW5449373.1 hypothetical protein [Cohnella sp. CFH 77786]
METGRVNLESFRAEQEKLLREMNKMLRISDAQSLALVRIKSELKALLDNAGQGFLTFDRSLAVRKQYSAECKRIFGRRIGGLPFAGLLYPGESEEREQTETILRMILEERDEFLRAMWLDLLPKERTIHGATVRLAYKIVDEPDGEPFCMAILTDITHERKLESEVERERRMLKMVVRAVKGGDELADVIAAYRRFCESPPGALARLEADLPAAFEDFYRSVHTFKGNFAQYGFVHIVPKLHELETELSVRRQELLQAPIESFAQFVASHRMSAWLEEDTAFLGQVLGGKFLQPSGVLMVEEEKLAGLERKISDLLPPREAGALLAELRKLRHRPIAELLKPYPEWVSGTAAKLGKAIYPLKVEGEPIAVELERYRPFARSLVHVFSNMIDHGIEPEERRLLGGKDPIGRITCTLERRRDCLILRISDDGKGIDPAEVRKRAAAAGMYGEEEAARIPDEEIVQLIFLGGLSTRDEVSGLSGRGVGLAAVKREAERIGGSVRVETRLGTGCSFIFDLPLME